MRTQAVEIYDDTSNSAVSRHPGRKFTGTLIQGDSLSILTGEAQWIVKRLSRSKDRALVAAAKQHAEKLAAHLANYERVLAEHNLSLPYVKVNDT